MFHNSNVFGSCIIHILYTGCANTKKNNSGAKRLKHIKKPRSHAWLLYCDTVGSGGSQSRTERDVLQVQPSPQSPIVFSVVTELFHRMESLERLHLHDSEINGRQAPIHPPPTLSVRRSLYTEILYYTVFLFTAAFDRKPQICGEQIVALCRD